MDELERIRNKHSKKKKDSNKSINLTKFLLVIILTLITLIAIKKDIKFKELFYKYIYEDSINFAKINEYYEKIFGSYIPFEDTTNKVTPVFNEKLTYISSNKYLDGVKLTVENNYLVPVLQSGLVVYMGEKEGYGNTVIVQGIDGIDIWYGNVTNISISLYDYIDKKSLLGTTKDDVLYLVYKKDGEILNYEEYL
ncbi:MAG: M23 family metallopeptidase [Bacilli bacterium]|nr:M23 family metallopeptidase [Bacilli bacterium]